MEPNDNKPRPPMPPLDLTRLNIRLANSKTVERAVRWQYRVQSFRSLPKPIQRLLGGRLTLILLENAADLALEDYLNEAITWH